MLTQTVRQMERDGLLARKVYPVVPPKVEYKLTDLGHTLSAAFCGVWVWAATQRTARNFRVADDPSDSSSTVQPLRGWKPPAEINESPLAMARHQPAASSTQLGRDDT
jgi:hypothetical protein